MTEVNEFSLAYEGKLGLLKLKIAQDSKLSVTKDTVRYERFVFQPSAGTETVTAELDFLARDAL